MRLQFFSTPSLAEYHGYPRGTAVHARPGDEVEVPEEAGKILLSDFPSNFFAVTGDLQGPPVDKQIKSAKVRK